MASAGVSTLRCLVVDDHPVVRQGIRALLERELDRVEVATAATPEAALQESGDPPDVVVIDLRRVSGDVQEAVTRLQETLQSPIVVFTADGGPRMLAEAPARDPANARRRDAYGGSGASAWTVDGDGEDAHETDPLEAQRRHPHASGCDRHSLGAY